MHTSIVYHRETGAIVQKTSTLSILQRRDAAAGHALLHLPPELLEILSDSHTHVRLVDGRVEGFLSRGGGFGGMSMSSTNPRVPEDRPTKVAVSSLGDVIMSLPAVEAYAATLSEGVTYVTDGQMVPFLERIPFVSRAVSGLRARYPKGRVVQLQSLGEEVPPHERIPRPEQYADILGVGIGVTCMPDYFVAMPEEMSWAADVVADLPRPVVMLSPFAGHPLKAWGGELELVEAMPDVSFIMVGKLGARADLPNLTVLAGKTTVTSLMALMSHCDAAGLLDTGIMHVAGMLGIPYLALFGGVHPSDEFTSLYPSVRAVGIMGTEEEVGGDTHDCSPCYMGRDHDCTGTSHERWCMRGMTTRRVSRALRAVLVDAPRGLGEPTAVVLPDAVKPVVHVRTRVAFVNTGGLGDLLVCLNAIRQARVRLEEIHGDVEVTMFARESYSILQKFPFVDEWRFARRGDTHRDILPHILGNYSKVFNLQYDSRLVLPENLASIPTFSGYPEGTFIGDSLAASLGDYAYEDDGVYLTGHLAGSVPGDRERANLDRGIPRNGPFVLVANGTDPTFPQGQTKSIPDARLVDILAEFHLSGVRTIQVGARGVRAVSAPGTSSVIGETTLEGLIYLMERSDGVVGADCGALHLAGQLGIPSAAIFGPTDPDLWGYPDALSLVSDNDCALAPCWLTHPAWHQVCVYDQARQTRGSGHCMGELDGVAVVEAVLRHIGLVL